MELLGVRIRIHPTFVWLLLIFFLLGASEGGVAGGARSVAWILIVFTFVVLHELSHSLVARAHGIAVHDITLLPIGGVARLGTIPEHSRTEFAIAIAGPALNFAVAALCFAGLVFAGAWLGDLLAGLLIKVIVVNLALGIFNLLPAFPMDGGRLLRAYLATKQGYLAATHTAARVGRWIAAAMAAYGVASFFNPNLGGSLWLLLIAAFIYTSGKQEEMAVTARHAGRGLWQLFGYGEPQGRWGGEESERSGDGDREYPRKDDVIDVEGVVKPDSDRAAADAFRKLGEDGDASLKR